ncbi:DUF3179 domain-containing protein [Acanthopleuribacter pedis]|uniref:DUF3179 domain-containing protein n=1 Tax=Acanthopleuribacter pedis TaxID=442870 RepID=A0A8J7QGD6_9BACT|nr:DUF3179 domain-containing protein [Acanthopleuribacter pedis]
MDGKVLEFNTSGALYHNALVMMDDQTDSFWAVISSEAVGGPMQGRGLIELPISQKTRWDAWLEKYPATMLLQVDGKVHSADNPYDNYFHNDKPFRPVKDPDKRLPLKEPVYGFKLDGTVFALRHKTLAGGWVGKAGKVAVVLFRHDDDVVYRSTRAYRLVVQGQAVQLKKEGVDWVSPQYGALDPTTGRFADGKTVLAPLGGMDTFWYIWSEYHKGVTLLGR